jgi:hypothetical protein
LSRIVNALPGGPRLVCIGNIRFPCRTEHTMSTTAVATSPFAGAAQAWHAATTPTTAEAKVDSVTFTSKLMFLVAVGYLTQEQADALLEWFESEGVYPLVPIPGPLWVEGLTMYDVFRTAIQFGAASPLEFDFFGLLGHVFDEAVDIIHHALEAAPAILHSAAEVLAAAAAA